MKKIKVVDVFLVWISVVALAHVGFFIYETFEFEEFRNLYRLFIFILLASAVISGGWNLIACYVNKRKRD